MLTKISLGSGGMVGEEVRFLLENTEFACFLRRPCRVLEFVFLFCDCTPIGVALSVTRTRRCAVQNQQPIDQFRPVVPVLLPVPSPPRPSPLLLLRPLSLPSPVKLTTTNLFPQYSFFSHALSPPHFTTLSSSAAAKVRQSLFDRITFCTAWRVRSAAATPLLHKLLRLQPFLLLLSPFPPVEHFPRGGPNGAATEQRGEAERVGGAWRGLAAGAIGRRHSPAIAGRERLFHS